MRSSNSPSLFPIDVSRYCGGEAAPGAAGLKSSHVRSAVVQKKLLRDILVWTRQRRLVAVVWIPQPLAVPTTVIRAAR